MLDEKIKEVIEGLFEDIGLRAEEIVAFAIDFARGYGKTPSYLCDVDNFSDNVVSFGKSMVCFQKDFTIIEDDEGELSLDDESEGDRNIMLDVQVQFIATEQSVKFYLNIVLTGEIEKSYETLPQELFEINIDTTADDMLLVRNFSKNLETLLRSDGMNYLAETSAQIMADNIIEEFLPLEELDKYK